MSDYDELEYLNILIPHRLYVQKKRRSELSQYEERSGRLLDSIGCTIKGLLINVAKSLHHDLDDEFKMSMKFRAKELKLVQELHETIDRDQYDAGLEKVLLGRCRPRDIRLKESVLHELARQTN